MAAMELPYSEIPYVNGGFEMTLMPRLGACLLVMSLSLVAATAFAKDDCDVPIDRWQSRDAVRQLADQNGWILQRVKIDDGCYEIRARDTDGRDFKAKLDPGSLEIVKIKYRNRRDEDRERH